MIPAATLLTLTGDEYVGSWLDDLRHGLARNLKSAIAFIPGVGPLISRVIPERMLTIPARALKISPSTIKALQSLAPKKAAPPARVVAVVKPAAKAFPWIPVVAVGVPVLAGGVYLATRKRGRR